MAEAKAPPAKVLGVIGSPRRGGNTEILVDEVLRGAQESGAATEKIVLTQLDIRPCLACDGCADSGECVQKDDMAGLFEKMQESQVWVLGTPVYWWGPSAQFKAYLDRWYAKAGEAHVDLFRGRRIVLAIPMGDTDVATARHTVGMFTDALDYVEAELFATLLATDANDRGEVQQQPQVMSAAFRAGREAVEE